MTVLFCDVTGSTTLGERQDPEQVRRVLSRYFEVARDVLERHGGTVEKFMGDAVMAVFGVPVLHEDDALRALRAASELRDDIERLNEDLEQVYGLRIAVRIGVNSGEVVAGDTIRGHSFAAGDAVNVAQRLEAAAEAGEILIGDATYRLARDAVRAESVGPLMLKGKEETVEAHRLLEVLPGVLSHTRRFDSPMVGRGRELHSLADAFERAGAERSCHLFTVLGAAGVGKSRLVREALAGIGDRARLLVGTCLPYGEGITFWPALEVVKQGTGIEDGDSPEQVLAKIEATLGDDENASLAARRVAALVGLEETGETAEQGFWGFRKLAESLARERPTVIVFDDVNWGEPHFLDLVEYLAESVRDAPLLVVVMARPELLELRPAWGGGKRNATSIFLEPLSEQQARELLLNLLAVDTNEDLVARIQSSAEGNPLFVEEMVSMLIDGGYLGTDGDEMPAGLAELPVPASIQVLLASRLDQLSVGERRAIERAAVEGTVFHSGAVEALADDELRGQVEDCLDALVRKELIGPVPGLFRRHRRLPLPACPHPRGGVRGGAEANSRRPARAVRGLAGGGGRRPTPGARGGARLPPRAGVSLPARGPAGGRPRACRRPAGGHAARVSRTARARKGRRARGGQPARPRGGAPAGRCEHATGATRRARHRAARLGRPRPGGARALGGARRGRARR